MRIKQFYLFFTLLIIFGWTWLGWQAYNSFLPSISVNVCWFKKATNIPCPGCGTTRAILELGKGNWLAAFTTNPLGIVALIAMLCTSVVLVNDHLRKQQRLFKLYNQTELWLKNPPVAISSLLLLMANWMWNITKGS